MFGRPARRAAGFLAAALATAGAVHGGNGHFDPATKSWRLTVSLDWEASKKQLAKVKDRLTQASKLLFDLTDGQMRFGKVTILDGDAGSDPDVVIKRGQGTAGSPIPGVGIFGQVLLLFCKDDIYTAPQDDDDTWQTIVHEFGHYALSLDEEYEKPNDAAAECVLPNASGNSTACIMDQYKSGAYENVSELCHAGNHDPDGDTKQQASFHKSCWQRVDDRFPISAPTGAPNDTPPPGFVAPEFAYFDDPTLVVALVLDASQSMNVDGGNGQLRIELVRREAERLIDLMSKGHVELGIVTFAEDATIVQPLTMLATDAEVAAAKGRLPASASGDSSIGRGLAKGRELLLTATPPISGPLVLILITAGFHNYPPGDPSSEPLAVLPTLVADDIRIHTVAFGDSTNDALLHEIADQSGALFWKSRGVVQTEPLLASIGAVIRGGSILASPVRQHLRPREVHVAEGWNEREGPRDLESLLAAAGKRQSGMQVPSGLQERLPQMYVEHGNQEVAFHLVWSPTSAPPSLVLKSPSGILIGPALAVGRTAPRLRIFRGDTYVSYVIEQAEPGWWSPAVVADSGPGAVTYALQPTVLNRNVTGYADAEVLAREEGAAIRLLASAQDNLAVTGYKLAATMTAPDGSYGRIDMFDDGNLAVGDEAAEDGLYSAIVLGTAPSASGTYQFDVGFDVDPQARPPATVVPGGEPPPTVDNRTLYAVRKFRRSFPVAVHIDAPGGRRDQDGDGILDEQEGRERDDFDRDTIDDAEESASFADTDGDIALPDPIWFSLYSYSRGPARFVAVLDDGMTLYVEAKGPNLETEDVPVVRRGALDAATVERLSKAVRKLRDLDPEAFDALRPIEAIEETGLLADVAADDGESFAEAGLALRGAMPPDVAKALERTAAAAAKLDLHRPLSLTQAETVDEVRANQIREDPRRFYSFVRVDQDRLRSLPALAAALRHPARVVELGPEENALVQEWRRESNPQGIGRSLFLEVVGGGAPTYYQLQYLDNLQR